MRQSSPVQLASHQSLLMCSHKGNQHANLMEVYKLQQRITGVILITSLLLGINIKSIKLKETTENIVYLRKIATCSSQKTKAWMYSCKHTKECIMPQMYCGNNNIKWQSSNSAARLTDLWAWSPISPPPSPRAAAEHLINCTFNKRKRWWIEKMFRPFLHY